MTGRLYESLTRNDTPAPADLIYVMAGRMDRKSYGLELYHAGLAPELVLGVGRFEVSKMYGVVLDRVLADQLIALRDNTPPDQRHFFVKLGRAEASIEKRNLRRWSTYGEILDLQHWLEANHVRRVLIVSTDIHLRRVALTCAKVFRGTPVEFLYCPVPHGLSSPGKEGRRFVIKELMKLVGYRVILSLPEWACRRLMRLKDLG